MGNQISTIKKNNNNEKKNRLPAIFTRGIYTFPKFNNVLRVGREVSLNAIYKSISEHNDQIIILAQKNDEKEYPEKNDVYQVGTLCKLTILETLETYEDQSLSINLQGIERIKSSDLKKVNNKYWECNYKIKHSIDDLTEKEKDKFKNFLISKIHDITNNYGSISTQTTTYILKEKEIGNIIDILTQSLPFLKQEVKQQIIEEQSTRKRYEIFIENMQKNEEKDTVERDISKKVQEKIWNQQREYYLREKLRAIREELNEHEGKEEWTTKILKEISQKPYPLHIKERIQKEIERYKQTHPTSPESNVIRNYVDVIMDIPWFQKSKENSNIKKARKILDKYHYGLQDVKKNIIGHLASRILSKIQKNKKNFAQIICLVGPPGIGKTSLAASIAKAIDRAYVRISLSGMYDKAEIKGHRKTYIGSMPGQIIQALRRAKVVNPLLLLDEIDKISTTDSYQGDAANALLSVLDPDQNAHFTDNYVEEEYDLSKVMFVATANYIDMIPEALKDRLEIIPLSHYSEIEKLEIARRHLIKKVKETRGIKEKQLIFTKPAIIEIIRHYTREAGVRQLERLLGRIAQSIAIKILEKNKKLPTKIDKNRIKTYLKRRIFEFTESDKKPQIGVVTGLAFTGYSTGDILHVESTYFLGKGHLKLTGKLGSVMKESAELALSYIKANRKKFGIKQQKFENDIHIHVPEAAVPKEGPSAGVTVTTAMISALKKHPIPKTYAMTGEITLRGKVLEIGGLKEKVIAAFNSGIVKNIFVPKKNKKDTSNIPKNILKRINLIFVDSYSQIYNHLFKEKEIK